MKICTAAINGRPSMNFRRVVLCRTVFIAINIASEPPEMARQIKKLSGTRVFRRRAAALSRTVMQTEITDINANHTMRSFTDIFRFPPEPFRRNVRYTDARRVPLPIRNSPDACRIAREVCPTSQG